MDDGHPKPSTLNHNRRQHIDTADTHGNDFRTRYEDELNSPCRADTFQTYRILARNSSNGCLAQGRTGRDQLGQVSAAAIRNARLLARTYSVVVAPGCWSMCRTLLKGSREKESGTEPDDSDEGYQEEIARANKHLGWPLQSRRT